MSGAGTPYLQDRHLTIVYEPLTSGSVKTRRSLLPRGHRDREVSPTGMYGDRVRLRILPFFSFMKRPHLVLIVYRQIAKKANLFFLVVDADAERDNAANCADDEVFHWFSGVSGNSTRR